MFVSVNLGLRSGFSSGCCSEVCPDEQEVGRDQTDAETDQVMQRQSQLLEVMKVENGALLRFWGCFRQRRLWLNTVNHSLMFLLCMNVNLTL